MQDFFPRPPSRTNETMRFPLEGEHLRTRFLSLGSIRDSCYSQYHRLLGSCGILWCILILRFVKPSLYHGHEVECKSFVRSSMCGGKRTKSTKERAIINNEVLQHRQSRSWTKPAYFLLRYVTILEIGYAPLIAVRRALLGKD